MRKLWNPDIDKDWHVLGALTYILLRSPQTDLAELNRLIPEMLKNRNFGKKSLKEIVDKLKELGLSLNMNVSQLIEGDESSNGEIFLDKRPEDSENAAVSPGKTSQKSQSKANTARSSNKQAQSAKASDAEVSTPAA